MVALAYGIEFDVALSIATAFIGIVLFLAYIARIWVANANSERAGSIKIIISDIYINTGKFRQSTRSLSKRQAKDHSIAELSSEIIPNLKDSMIKFILYMIKGDGRLP
jgi:hypothetical protein